MFKLLVALGCLSAVPVHALVMDCTPAAQGVYVRTYLVHPDGHIEFRPHDDVQGGPDYPYTGPFPLMSYRDAEPLCVQDPEVITPETCAIWHVQAIRSYAEFDLRPLQGQEIVKAEFSFMATSNWLGLYTMETLEDGIGPANMEHWNAEVTPIEPKPSEMIDLSDPENAFYLYQVNMDITEEAREDLSQNGWLGFAMIERENTAGTVEIYDMNVRVYTEAPIPTPEPASMGLVGLGLVAAWKKRRKLSSTLVPHETV